MFSGVLREQWTKQPCIQMKMNQKSTREVNLPQFKVQFPCQSSYLLWKWYQWICVDAVISHVMVTVLWVKLYNVCWFHENFSNSQYKSFTSLAKYTPYMLYFCNHNKCYLQPKCIVAEFIKSSTNESVKLSNLFEIHFKDLTSPWFPWQLKLDKA